MSHCTGCHHICSSWMADLVGTLPKNSRMQLQFTLPLFIASCLKQHYFEMFQLAIKSKSQHPYTPGLGLSTLLCSDLQLLKQTLTLALAVSLVLTVNVPKCPSVSTLCLGCAYLDNVLIWNVWRYISLYHWVLVWYSVHCLSQQYCICFCIVLTFKGLNFCKSGFWRFLIHMCMPHM